MERWEYIGSTDAPAIIGTSRYKTPFDVYLAKAEKMTTPMNAAMDWGLRLEAAVAGKCADELGHALAQGKLVTHHVYSFLGGSPDYLSVTDLSLLIECKTSSEQALSQTDENGFPLWGEVGTDEVPADYWVQCQYLMGLTGRTRACLPVLFLGPQRQFRMYWIDFDGEFFEMLVQKCVEFHQKHIAPQVPPPMDAAPSYLAMVWMARKAQEGGAEAECDAETLDLAMQMEEIGRKRQTIEAQEDELKAKILKFMSENGIQKLRGRAYDAAFSIGIQGGGEGKSFTLWQNVAESLAKQAGMEKIPDDLISTHSQTGNPTKPHIRGFFNAVRTKLKQAQA